MRLSPNRKISNSALGWWMGILHSKTNLLVSVVFASLFRGMVVRVERGTERISGPTGSFQLLEKDLLWIVSDRRHN